MNKLFGNILVISVTDCRWSIISSYQSWALTDSPLLTRWTVNGSKLNVTKVACPKLYFYSFDFTGRNCQVRDDGTIIKYGENYFDGSIDCHCPVESLVAECIYVNKIQLATRICILFEFGELMIFHNCFEFD